MANEKSFLDHIADNKERLTAVTQIQKFQLHFQPKSCFCCSKEMKRNNLFCEFVTSKAEEENVVNVNWYTICKKCLLKLPAGLYGLMGGKVL